jgi:hypothetical protein
VARALFIGLLTALVLAGATTRSGAGAPQTPQSRSGDEPQLRLGRAGAVLGPTARTASWHGGVLTAATGEQVRVEVSDAYVAETVSAQAWADFFAGLVHGKELASVTVRVAPVAEVKGLCGEEALGCYGGGMVVIPGELSGGATPEEIARHEYGHHVAASRLNSPWRAIDWGPKRWATQARVCERTAAGTAFPDGDGEYRLRPAEAFAETYRVLNERRDGLALTWPIVDNSFIPNESALSAVEDDVEKPWLAPVTKTVLARFRQGAPRRWQLQVAAPLDGELTAELRLPPGRLDRLELLSADGRVLARGSWASTSTRRLTFVVCGQRRLALRVTRAGTPGRFDLTVTRP